MDLKVNDTLPVQIQAEDKFGNPTSSVGGVPTWSVADPTLGSFAASDDGLSGTFTPSGKEGATQLQANGAIGDQKFVASLDLNLIAGDAVQLVIQPGTPIAEAAAPTSTPAPTTPVIGG